MSVHWILLNPNNSVVNEFDTNAGGGVLSELVAARTVAQAWCSANMTKVRLCWASRLMTPSSVPPPPTVQDDPI